MAQNKETRIWQELKNLDKHKEQLDKAEIFGFRFYPSNYKMVYK